MLPLGDAPLWVMATCLPRNAGHEEWLDYHQYEDIRTLINNRQNNRRRGRGGGPRPNGPNTGGNDRGNRIDNRSRGNASQLFEKYKTLARDSQMQGDRVMSEYYFQFADHYFRVLNENRSRFEEQNRGRPDQNERDDQYDYADDNDGNAENGPPAYVERGYRERPAVTMTPVQQVPTDVYEESTQTYDANGQGEGNGQQQMEPTRNGRGRPPRPRRERPSEAPLLDAVEVRDQEERIEIDRLPPAFAAPEAEAPADKPKRRGRPRRSESAPIEV